MGYDLLVEHCTLTIGCCWVNLLVLLSVPVIGSEYSTYLFSGVQGIDHRKTVLVYRVIRTLIATA